MAGLQSQWRNLGFQRALPVLHQREMPNTTEERGRYNINRSNTTLLGALKAVDCISSNYKEADFSWKPTLYHNLRMHPAEGCSPLMLPEWSVPCLNQKNFIKIPSRLTTVGSHSLKTLTLTEFSCTCKLCNFSLFLFEHILQFLFYLLLITTFLSQQKISMNLWDS